MPIDARRDTIHTAIAAGAGACGIISFAAPWVIPLSPLVGLFDLPVPWNYETVSLFIVTMLSLVVGMWWIHQWPITLLRGAALMFPLAAAHVLRPLFMVTDVHWLLIFMAALSSTAGQSLVLISVLGAAQDLYRPTAPGWSAAMAGIAIGAAILGPRLFVPSLAFSGQEQAFSVLPILPIWLNFGLVSAALTGGIIALKIRPGGLSPLVASRTTPRMRALGLVATVFPITSLLVFWGLESVFSAAGLLRIAGALGLILVAVVSTTLARGALVRLVAVAIVVYAAFAPAALTVRILFHQQRSAVPLVLFAIFAGLVVLHARRPTVWASVVCLVASGTLLGVWYAAGSNADAVFSLAQRAPVAMWLAPVLAAATATTVAMASRFGQQGTLAILLGPLLAVFLLSLRQLTASAVIAESNRLSHAYIVTEQHLMASAVALLFGAGLLAWIAMSERRQTDRY